MKRFAVGAVALILLIVVVGLVVFQQLNTPEARLRAALASGVMSDKTAAVLEVVTPDNRWAVTQGLVDTAGNQPVTSEQRFRIGSTSKTFVAVVLLQLVEEGVLRLDDLAAPWLPNAVVTNLANANVVTVRHLLQMRSGVPEYLEQPFLDAVLQEPTRPVWSPLDVLAYAYDKDAYFAPGAEFRYTNSNYILLQLVLESATGQSLHELLRTRILDPLAMTNSYTQIQETLPGGFVHGYSAYKGDGTLVDVTDYNDGAGLADGALVSTTGDLIRFYQALFQARTLLTEASMTEMLDFQETGEAGVRYGLGLNEYQTEAGRAYGHPGGVLGFGAIALYLPEREMTLVALYATDAVDLYTMAQGAINAVDS